MKALYLIEIERVKDPGDFEGNDVPPELKPMSALQLQKAIAYDLVRIRSADLASVPSHKPEYGGMV